MRLRFFLNASSPLPNQTVAPTSITRKTLKIVGGWVKITGENWQRKRGTEKNLKRNADDWRRMHKRMRMWLSCGIKWRPINILWLRSRSLLNLHMIQPITFWKPRKIQSYLYLPSSECCQVCGPRKVTSWNHSFPVSNRENILPDKLDIHRLSLILRHPHFPLGNIWHRPPARTSVWLQLNVLSFGGCHYL